MRDPAVKDFEKKRGETNIRMSSVNIEKGEQLAGLSRDLES